MSHYQGERFCFEELHPFDQYELERISKPVSPLGILSEYIEDWADRKISPPAVPVALGHLVGRSLNNNETRNAISWMEEEIERHQATQGEVLWQQQ